MQEQLLLPLLVCFYSSPSSFLLALCGLRTSRPEISQPSGWRSLRAKSSWSTRPWQIKRCRKMEIPSSAAQCLRTEKSKTMSHDSPVSRTEHSQASNHKCRELAMRPLKLGKQWERQKDSARHRHRAPAPGTACSSGTASTPWSTRCPESLSAPRCLEHPTAPERGWTQDIEKIAITKISF